MRQVLEVTEGKDTSGNTGSEDSGETRVGVDEGGATYVTGETIRS